MKCSFYVDSLFHRGQMMKSKIGRGHGSGGAISYILDAGSKRTGEKNPVMIGGTITGNTVKEIKKEFTCTHRIRPDIGQFLEHISLSLPPGEMITADKWDIIVRDYLTRLGFDPQKNWIWFAALHNDKPHSHVHILVSRIALDGTVFLGHHEIFKSIEICQQLEKEYGLIPTKGLGSKMEKALSTKELAMLKKRNPSKKKVIKLIVKAILKANKELTWKEFVDKLQETGICTLFNTSKLGKASGVSFSYEGLTVKGSKLGKAFSFTNLSRLMEVETSNCSGVEKKTNERSRNYRTR